MLKRAERKRQDLLCHDCGHPVGADFAFCPHCGAAASYDETPSEHDVTDTAVLDAIFDLPAGVDVGAGRVARDRRKLTAAFVVILLVLGSIGAWSWLHFRDASARDALDESRLALAEPIAELNEAESLEDLHAAAAGFADTTDDLATTRTNISGDTEMAAAARDTVAAREQLATAAATLSSVTADDFSAWIDVRTVLVDAVASADAARAGLARVNEERAAGSALPADLVAGVETVVGGEMLTASASSFTDAFDAMESAGTTADLRAVGSTAESMGAGVAAVVDGFDAGSTEHEQLNDYLGVYEAVAGLTSIDADHLTDWAGVRSDVVSSVAAVGAADAAWTGQADGALDSVDELVSDAQEQLRTWQDEHDAAAAAKDADIESVGTYVDAMTAQLGRYSELRSSLSDWIDMVEDPASFVTYDEAYDVLWRAETDRQAVRDAMAAMTVPAALSGTHNELVSVIDDGIAGVAAAYQGALDSEWCTFSCYYKDTPGWRTFRAESARITDAFGVAVAQWESQSADAQAEAENRPLPEKPVV